MQGTSLVAQTVKKLPAVQETLDQSLGREDPLEKRMVTLSSILAWRIPWTGSLLACSPWGHKELDMTERLILLLSLVVQWLRLCIPNAEGLGSISGQGTRSYTLQQKIQNSETETQRSLVAQTVKNLPAMQETRL